MQFPLFAFSNRRFQTFFEQNDGRPKASGVPFPRIKSSHLCKILLPVKGTSPSGNGTALRPLLFTQNPGLHPFPGCKTGPHFERLAFHMEKIAAGGTGPMAPGEKIFPEMARLRLPINGRQPERRVFGPSAAGKRAISHAGKTCARGNTGRSGRRSSPPTNRPSFILTGRHEKLRSHI